MNSQKKSQDTDGYGWQEKVTLILDRFSLFLLFFTVWISIAGRLAIDAGPVRFTLNKPGHFLLGVVVILVVRGILAGFGIGTAFSFTPRSKRIFLRFLELGLAVQVILIPVVWNIGLLKSAVFESQGLGLSLVTIFVMLVLRLVLGRNFRALSAVISTTVTLAIVLVGLEFVLRAQESHQLKEATTEPLSPVIELSPASNDPDFDPTRNDGVDWTWGHPVVRNRFGFREDDFAVPKPEGLFRLMILGDSLTWGAGLEARDRYSDRLEQLLREALSDREIEVVNFGYQGGPTIHERDLLLKLHEEVKPDLIVVGFCINDPQPRSQNYSPERARLDDLYHATALLRYIGLRKTYSWLIGRINQVFVNLDAIPSWQQALDRTYQPDSKEWQDFTLALEEIKGVSDHRGLPAPVFVLLIQGIASDQKDPPFETSWFKKAGNAAGALGFVVVDPAPRFRNELTLADLPVNPLDGHPSAVCNRIYAEEIFKAVLPLITLAETP